MSVQLNSGFFNATMVNGEPDRVYSASDVNDYIKGLISESGIFATISSACQVVANGGMQVVVKEGRGKVGNNWFEIDKDIIINIPSADVILNRIDRIVISRDNSNRLTTITLKQGTLATNPVAPSLTRNDDVYEICLANIIVNKNTATITTAMIEDTRSNSDLCGWIVGLIKEFDTTTLFNQYRSAQTQFINQQTTEFEDWFNNVKETISATSLYREYTATYATKTTNER